MRNNIIIVTVLSMMSHFGAIYAQGSCPGGQCPAAQNSCPSGQCPARQGSCPSGQCPAQQGGCPSGQCPAQAAGNQYYQAADSYYPGYYPSYKYPNRRNNRQCCVRPYYRQQEYDFTWARRNFENRDKQYCSECGEAHQNNGYYNGY